MAPRVLVVDDDDSIRQIVSLLLSDEGYEVLAVAHGRAALAAIERYFVPDVILLDLRMPVMDGWEFARRYREQPSNQAPIIVFAAGLNPAEESAHLGAAGVVAKPFDVDDLLRAVRSLLAVST